MYNSYINFKVILGFLFSLIVTTIFAQYTGGGIVFEGATYKYNSIGEAKPILGATITIYRGEVKINQIKSGKKGSFSMNLPYGSDYKISFSSPGTIDMFLMIYASAMPDNKRDILAFIDGGTIPCFDTAEKTVDLNKYKFPFNKYIYDGKKSFVEDLQYFDDFQKGVFTEYKDAKALIELGKKKKGEARMLILSGRLLAGESPGTPLKNIKLELVDDKGGFLQKAITGDLGKFVFKNISSQVNFLIKLSETNVTIPPNTKITVINKYGEIIMQTMSGNRGQFEFKLLESDKSDLKNLEVSDDVLSISGNLMAMMGKKSQPVANTQLSMVNNKGVVIETVTTNMFGSYVFTNAPADGNFTIKIDGKLPEHNEPIDKIVITDNSGNEVRTASGNEKAGFDFTFLPSDSTAFKLMGVDDRKLKTDFKGKLWADNAGATGMQNLKIELIGADGKTIQTTTTNKIGEFEFKYLDPMANYVFRFDSTDVAFKTLKKIVMTDADDNFVKDISASQGSSSISLSEKDLKKISSTYIDDPWLKIANTTSKGETTGIKIENGFAIPERVYFESGGATISTQSQKVLDKVVQVMKSNLSISIEISAHTDSKGDDTFNLQLSKKRAKMAFDYMVSKGVEVKRLTNVGFGETKLLNKCANGVICTEEEHAENRRLEFKISNQ